MAHIKISEDPIIKPTITNTYRVAIVQMSGDADAYNAEAFSFDQINDALDFAILATQIQEAQSNGYGTSIRELVSLLPVGPTYNTDLLHEICGHDVTCEGQLAAVDDVVISYFDQHGVEFPCELVID